jgi:(2R)-3-sulfolactate dehydrogenase (NADP+)
MSMTETLISVDALTELVTAVLVHHNTSRDNAEPVAQALVAAEIDGQKGHGLSRVASYSAQVKSGKVDGQVIPEIKKVGEALLRVDAKHGFAFPAFTLAIEDLSKLAEKKGIAAAAIANSHHCGMLGYHAEKLSSKGLVALVFSNSPKAIAPWGGKEAVFGTNPIAFAAPRKNDGPLVIDLSLSKVARGKIKVAHEANQPIPDDWALDAHGDPTSDAGAAMSGTMLPMGDAKGAMLVLMVEILSAALSASHFGFEASSFFTAEGPSPDIGQLMVAIHPGGVSQNRFFERIESLLAAILGQSGTRLPGSGKAILRENAARAGIRVPTDRMNQLLALKG